MFPMKQAVSLILFLIVLLLPTLEAKACPEGQYEACVFRACACVPNGGTVTRGLNPLPDTLNILGGVVHGDIHAISQGVGGLVIKSSCTGCAVAAQTVLSSNDKAFVEMVVGRGWLVFLGTGSPSLVLADAATSVVKSYELTHPPANPLQPAPPANRGTKDFRVSGALCMVRVDADNSLAAGFVDAPVFQNEGKTFTWPAVDLQPGDILTVDAAGKECPKVPSGQTLLSNAKMKYSYETNQPTTTTTAMKYFLVGKFMP